MATSEEIYTLIVGHLAASTGQIDTVSKPVIQLHISEACKNIASSEYWLDTLQMTVLSADSEGKVELPEKAVIHQAYYSSDSSATITSKSWRRLTAIDYSYFLRNNSSWNSGYSGYSPQLGERRYTVIPNTMDRNKTLIQLLDYPESTTKIMVSYFPRNPDPTVFPDDFKLSIVLEAIISLSPFIKAEAVQAFTQANLLTAQKSLAGQKKLNNKVEYDDVDLITSESDYNYMKSDVYFWTSGNYWY